MLGALPLADLELGAGAPRPRICLPTAATITNAQHAATIIFRSASAQIVINAKTATIQTCGL